MTPTKTMPGQPPSVNPSPRAIFLTEAQWIDAHHKLIESEAFQRAIHMGLEHYTRAMCSAAPADMTMNNYQQAAALTFARIQGANDIIQLMCSFAELPPPAPAGKKATDNLEN